MPIEGSHDLELMLLLFPEFHRDIVLAGPSDLTYQVTHNGPFLPAPYLSLHIPRCYFSYPGSWGHISTLRSQPDQEFLHSE